MNAARGAGFTYAFDTGSGYGAFSGSNSASVTPTDNGSVVVKGKVRDKDGGITESISKRIPILVHKLQFSTFPEGGKLVICGLRDDIFQLMKLTHLDRILKIAPDRDAAMKLVG